MTTLTEPGTTPRVDPLGPPGSHRFTPVGDEAFHVKRPRWARPALAVLLIATAVLYFWNLSNSGYANEFYAAAVKSGAKSWEAWLFGSLDSSNAITVDKPPASLWVMGLSARSFGFSSWSLLAPQALMGVGTVALTYGAVRRFSGYAAGLFAGALVALTPVAALMFRFDNPDAMLVFLMTAAAYLVVRAIQTDRRRAALRWMVGAGLVIGLAFLTKMLQGLLVLPGLGLAYFVAAKFSLKTRILHSIAALVGVVVGAGWLVALVSLWPASARPYIGGSTNNSLWELALGYNGLGRILGGSGNGGGGGMGGANNANSGFGGSTGILRMFNSAFGTEISWLLPAAVLLLLTGLVARGRRPRTDGVRASLILWGGWLIVTALCMSFMEGTIHPYYVVALAPAVAACVAVGGREAVVRGEFLRWRIVTAVAVCGTAAWSVHLLSSAAGSWMPWLRWVSLAAAVVGSVGYVAARPLPARSMRRAATAGLVIGVLGALGGTSAWTVATAAQGHNGSIPTSGPAVAGSKTGGMGGGGTAPTGGAPSQSSTGSTKSGTAPAGNPPSGSMPGGAPPSGTKPSGNPPSGSPGASSNGGGSASGSSSGSSAKSGATEGGSTSTQGGVPGGTGGGMGASTSNAALVKLLNATNSTWSAAVIGDQSAAGYILSTDTAVMSIGGWSGTDNNVTLAQFEQYVSKGQLHYFIASGSGGSGMGGNSGSSAQITAWVKAHFAAKTVDGVTVYDLTQKTS